jgi:hypothetical protein
MSNKNNQTQKKSGGCGKAIGIGCLSIFLILAAGSFLAYRGFKTIIVKLADEYTETAPMTLPTVEISDQDLAALFARVDTFSKSVKAGEGSGLELTLTANDINALIQKNPAWSSVAGKVFVRIENGCIHGDASIPLDSLGQSFIGASFLKGRWLNGSGGFHVAAAAGRLLVFMDSLTVHNKALPENFMTGIRTKNLAEEATKNPETAALIQKLESVRISDNKLHITGK